MKKRLKKINRERKPVAGNGPRGRRGQAFI